MKQSIPPLTKAAIALLAGLSFGPLVCGLDLLYNFLPTSFPAFQHLHAASLLGKSLWVCSGFLGVLAAVCVVRLPLAAAVTATAFAAAYISGANLVWLYFTAGCWLAICAIALTFFGARAAKQANYALKRTCAE